MNCVKRSAQGDRITPSNAGMRVQDRDKANVIARGVNVFVVSEELNDFDFGYRTKTSVVD